MDDNGIKVKTMENIVSGKNSFKWLAKDDIIHHDTPKILASIQQSAPISNCFFGIQKHELEKLLLQISTWK